MEKIFTHIERLLAYHDYVVVPDFGGFVVQQKSAIIMDDHIEPPVTTIGFNSLMHHSDGLLAIEVAREEGITFRKAMELIETEIENFKIRLQTGEIQNFGRLGFFKRNQDAVLEFHPSANIADLPQNIGLNILHVSEFTQKAVRNVDQKLTIKLPTVRTIRYAAAACLIAGMLMISPKLTNERHTSTADLSSFLTVTQPTLVITDSAKCSPCTGLDTLNNQKGIAKYNDKGLYHVVVASLATHRLAERYCKELKREDFECAHVLPPVNTYRVSIEAFKNRKEALIYMRHLRESDARFRHAWVYWKRK